MTVETQWLLSPIQHDHHTSSICGIVDHNKGCLRSSPHVTATTSTSTAGLAHVTSRRHVDPKIAGGDIVGDGRKRGG